MRVPVFPRDPPMDDPPIRLAVCVSGGGSTLQNLIDKINDGSLRASIVQVIASKSGIGAIARSTSAGIPIEVVTRKGRSLEEFGSAVFQPIRERGVDLLILGGFLALLPIPGDYIDKVINIHPSLIPAFSGRGFHGEAVHRAAIEAGVKVSGCTVHFADNEYDAGPIILQKTVEVFADDTPRALAARVFEAECVALPEAIELYAAGRLRIEGRKVHIMIQSRS